MNYKFVLVIFSAGALLGQKVETEGKAWLDLNTAPAEVNVNGSWHAGEWGLITLNQADGSRDVTGKVQTGNLAVSGVVSVRKVSLLFAEKGRVQYSVEVSLDGSNVLAGHYADGLDWKAGTRLMHLTRADAQDHSSLDSKAGQAHVVVYRVARLTARAIKPSVYLDDEEAALMYSGYYFTVALSRGKHTLASSGQYTGVTLDAEPGATYYVRVASSKEGALVRNKFDVEQVDGATALKELQGMKPADASQITRRDIVSAAPISKN